MEASSGRGHHGSATGHLRSRAEAPSEARILLPPVAASAREARHFLSSALAGWGLDGLADVAVLLVSELVTNAVLHARTDLEVVVRCEADRVHVEVRDGSAGSPAVRPRSATSTTGRGLALVEACAASWGVQSEDPGKAVWFDLSA